MASVLVEGAIKGRPHAGIQNYHVHTLESIPYPVCEGDDGFIGRQVETPHLDSVGFDIQVGSQLRCGGMALFLVADSEDESIQAKLKQLATCCEADARVSASDDGRLALQANILDRGWADGKLSVEIVEWGARV